MKTISIIILSLAIAFPAALHAATPADPAQIVAAVKDLEALSFKAYRSAVNAANAGDHTHDIYVLVRDMYYFHTDSRTLHSLLVSGVNTHPALVTRRLNRMDKESVQVDTVVASTNQAPITDSWGKAKNAYAKVKSLLAAR